MNGINPNAMNAMANGANGLPRTSENAEDMKAKLNTWIYDYLLRNEQWDVARKMRDSGMAMQTSKTAPPRKANGDENGEDTKDELDSKKPNDLPWPMHIPEGATDNSFMLDWFVIFWEMFFMARKHTFLKPAPATAAYLNNVKEQQQMMARQSGMPNGVMNNYPAMMRGAQPGMNMAARNMSQMPQHRNLNPQQQQAMILQARSQQAMLQQQMAREGGDVDMNDPNILGQAQFNSFQGQNQKKNLDAYAQNMQQTVRQSMPQNMQGQMMEGQAIQDFYAGNSANPAMRGQMQQNGQAPGAPNGNHALQDYQMQLMLLEQQNKKRLLMARQEQDQVRPGEAQMQGQGGFAPNMSPQGSRSGPSPNPSEQMKRGTPKMGQAGLPGGPNSPMPDGQMHARGSPGVMNFNGMDMMQQMKGPDGMPIGPGMRAPSSHPGYNGPPGNAAQMEAMRLAQQRGGMPNGANWPQMPSGQAPGMQQGGQPGQMGTPQQRNVAMPPPQNVPAQNGANGRPVSPAQSAASGTPQPANKAAPAKKGKAGKDTKKQPAKKGAAAATPSADEPPQTPTPATPITPLHPNSFKDGKGVNGAAQPTTGQINTAVPAPAAQIAQPQADISSLQGFDAMEGLEAHGGLNMHFGGMDTGDVLEQFDFDAFLDTGDPNELNFDAMASYGNFEGIEAEGT